MPMYPNQSNRIQSIPPPSRILVDRINPGTPQPTRLPPERSDSTSNISTDDSKTFSNCKRPTLYKLSVPRQYKAQFEKVGIYYEHRLADDNYFFTVDKGDTKAHKMTATWTVSRSIAHHWIAKYISGVLLRLARDDLERGESEPEFDYIGYAKCRMESFYSNRELRTSDLIGDERLPQHITGTLQ
ncbi:hypothetical protein BJ138DRAFT_1103805 [Hygrophoropsis aurantiaca]|uniref:Uncharacterized protein n=1 Tax=Hygrophoropsis aurantiaca TaxID=72124 RepID=A0ACB8A4R7_9AGAM|nr:hypothetical protein BJ138DRAFT_1103805 [Hygrophoropsis aurantiaca]